MVEDAVDVFRLAIGREPHQLVLAGIDLEAGVIGEGGIEQARANAGSAAPSAIVSSLPRPTADRGRAPFADAVHA